jgi:hypothetical protein
MANNEARRLGKEWFERDSYRFSTQYSDLISQYD